MPTQRQMFLQHLAQTNDIPLALEIERAEGCYMHDKDGKRYLDLIAGIGVSALGHCHPVVIEAIEKQIRKYSHLMVYGEFVQTPQVAYAKALTDTLPANLDCVYFTNSGTEATEGAMKLAKRYTGRREIISCYNAYHGSTQGALSIAGGEELKNAFRPLLPDIRQIRHNIMEDLKQITEYTAAVFIEPIQGEAGARVADDEYLKALRERCTEVGALLVYDEIQCGFGRCGTLWHSGRNGISPDILLLGKALGGGMPLGAFISSKAIMHTLSFDPVLGHITTFGGHPVSCAAGLAAFEYILNEGLIEQVEAKAQSFRNKLHHKAIKALHGKGLLMALEVGSFDNVQKLIRYCIENRVVSDWFLFNVDCIRIAPPLIISDEEIDEACDVIMRGLDQL